MSGVSSQISEWLGATAAAAEPGAGATAGDRAAAVLRLAAAASWDLSVPSCWFLRCIP